MTAATVELGQAIVAVPDRNLNLADPADWDRAAALVGAPAIAVMTAEHGVRVRDVTQPGRQQPADTLVTAQPGLALAALAADCVPVALAGPGVVAVVHAGWRGVLDGAVPAALAHLTGTATGPFTAVIGPSICGNCYEVPAQRVAEFAQRQPAAVRGTRHLDLAAAVIDQLAGVQITHIAGCTLERADLCSYRGGDQERRGGIIAALRHPS